MTGESRPERAIISWSSGKDSAYSLGRLRADPRVELAGVLTTVTDTFHRVSMHGVREELLEVQAERLGLPLLVARIPFPCPNERYEAAMREVLDAARADGVTSVAFGDLYLEDIRRYREEKLRGTGFTPRFPLWGEPTRQLAERMIDDGYRAILVAVDPKKLDASFAGREFDHRLLAELPSSVDPCGENGEFHTFVYDAPIFHRPIPVERGPVVVRDGFVFADVVLSDDAVGRPAT